MLDAPILVDYTGLGITTQGGNGIGIAALSGGGGIAINSIGPITTSGPGAFGIFANNTNLIASFPSEFKATPVFNGVPIGTIEVNATTVTTTGEFSTGIVANGTGNVAVNVLPGGSVSGGWQAGLTGGSSLFNLPATGVILNSINGVATLTNDGSIGALSDRAVGGTAQIINNGTMTGFVELTGTNQFINNGTFDLRHFADTNGDGTRDTLRVAVSNLGGLGSTFTNNGTLALRGAPGATTLDNTGQYLPPGSTGNAMALNGPVQGQVLSTTTFINSGSINLQANPVPGDVLLISGGQTPGTNGGGVFASNGGRLLVDTVLNEGDPNSRSDVLVLDSATVAAGPTRLSVANAGGLGAVTLGNGILVVQAVPGGTTAPAAFALAGPVVAGPYDYLLFRGSRDASAPESWFLRSTIDCALAPNDPACKIPEPGPGPTPPGPLKPNFRPETSLYAAIPALALLYGRTLLDTLHERVGEEEDLRARRQSSASPYSNGTWGRVIAQHGNRDGDDIGIFGAGPRYDYDFGAFQIGQDFYRWQQANGYRTHAGVYGAIGGAHSDVTHFDGFRAGDDNFMAYSAGGYWTTFGPTGWYVDSVLQGTFYDLNGNSNRLPALHTEGWGLGASLEGGAPFKVGGGWQIEPQVQLIYQAININEGSDIGATVRFDDVNSLAGRIGVRFANTFAMPGLASPGLVTAWFRPNLWHEFLGDPKTLFSSETGFIPFRADLGGSWVELNTGISAQINRTTSLYANASYQIGLDGDSTAWDGKVGLRFNW